MKLKVDFFKLNDLEKLILEQLAQQISKISDKKDDTRLIKSKLNKLEGIIKNMTQLLT